MINLGEKLDVFLLLFFFGGGGGLNYYGEGLGGEVHWKLRPWINPCLSSSPSSLQSKSQSKSGHYLAAKTYSIIALGFLTVGTLFCLLILAAGPIFFAYVIPRLEHDLYFLRG